jgi:hypothetical protein
LVAERFHLSRELPQRLADKLTEHDLAGRRGIGREYGRVRRVDQAIEELEVALAAKNSQELVVRGRAGGS